MVLPSVRYRTDGKTILGSLFGFRMLFSHHVTTAIVYLCFLGLLCRINHHLQDDLAVISM